MPCQRPCDCPPRVSHHLQDSKLPVGILVDPLIVGDKPKDKNEKVRFYPTRVQERDRKLNWVGFVPDCPNETTYQEHFEYRGKDPRRCRTYEFRANGEKCTFSVCLAPPMVPAPFYGRRINDLNLTIPKAKPYLIDDNTPTHWSEYTRTYSKLGRQIISYNLFVREAVRHEERIRKQRMYRA